MNFPIITQGKYMFLIFFGFFLLASAITTNKVILYSLPPALFVGIRMLIPGLIMYLYNFSRSKRLRFTHFKFDLPIILLCAASTTFIPSVLKAYALKNLISSKQAFLGSLDPFIAAFYAYFIFHEKITPRKFIGLCLGFIGVFILLATTTPTEESIGSIWIFSYPELAMLLAVSVSRFGWTWVQKILKEDRYTPIEFNCLLMMVSGFLSLLSAGFTENIMGIHIDRPGLFTTLLTYTMIIGNIAGYGIYAHVLKRYSTTFIALAGFSVPIFVHIFGFLFLGEPLSINFFAAISITTLGLFIFYQDEVRVRSYQN